MALEIAQIDDHSAIIADNRLEYLALIKKYFLFPVSFYLFLFFTFIGKVEFGYLFLLLAHGVVPQLIHVGQLSRL